MAANISENYLNKIDGIRSLGIDKIAKSWNISYADFSENYLKLNIPCMLCESFTDQWRSRREWVKENGEVDWQALRNLFSDAEVPVVECTNKSYGYDSVTVLKMKFSEFVNCIQSKDLCYYLKDWHCTKQFPDYKFYDVPLYFKSDWLNEFWEDKEDDYKFVYIGPKGSWTPLHADVLRSYSWSANVCGKKRWVIYYPGCQPMGPHANEKNQDGSKFEVIQNAGEIIFIPSGWFHEVYNEEDTISINHNWINEYNVGKSWTFLKSRLLDVQKEIQEFKQEPDFLLQCQRILRADSGMDYMDFFNFLHCISSKRMNSMLTRNTAHQSFLQSDVNLTHNCNHTSKIQDDECVEQLQTILCLLGCMVEDCDFKTLLSDNEDRFVINPLHYFKLLREYYENIK
ncbi:hypothetical protein HELRODRAFT_95474 [Helobdella robusta]|uniref:Jumonji domain-containing protein 4 n=1 Tax=Helobdella robusta TaxID=6412 RepID=T1G961_HELRO|nr:hypothetical protein HELRODRAFT_95474 [Helobdella robusta]ESN96513.1 hypothetical protein HELRODRAFT_95474 [Helobdella robusta]